MKKFIQFNAVLFLMAFSNLILYNDIKNLNSILETGSMKSKADCEEKKEYYQFGYTVIAFSDKIAVIKIPLFVCLNEIEKKVPIGKCQETIDQMRKNLETPYLHRCDCLEKEGYQFYELKEGYVLRDTKDQKAKLIYETYAIYGLRDRKGDSTNSFQIYYKILISPKKTFLKQQKICYPI